MDDKLTDRYVTCVNEPLRSCSTGKPVVTCISVFIAFKTAIRTHHALTIYANDEQFDSKQYCCDFQSSNLTAITRGDYKTIEPGPIFSTYTEYWSN